MHPLTGGDVGAHEQRMLVVHPADRGRELARRAPAAVPDSLQEGLQVARLDVYGEAVHLHHVLCTMWHEAGIEKANGVA